MYIFVDVETNVGSMGAYLTNYKATLESGTVKYKMGVYCDVDKFADVNRQFNLSNTYTWIAKWNSSYSYPNWPTSYSSEVVGKGNVKMWQFIKDQYTANTNVGDNKLDLNLTTDSYPAICQYMYHPNF